MSKVSNYRSNWASSRSIPGYDQETEGQRRARVQGEAYGDYLADHLTVSPTFYNTQSPLSKIAERSTRERYRANTGYNLPESPF